MGQDGRHAIRQVVTGPRVPVDVVHGQQEALAEDDVELRRHDRVAIAQVEQHDVDDPVGRLDLGALVALEDVLDDQGVEAERLADLQRLGLRRGDEIDPDARLRLAQELGHPGHRGRALELDDAVAAHGDDPDRARLTWRADRMLSLDSDAERDRRRVVRGRGRVRAHRGHRRRILRQRAAVGRVLRGRCVVQHTRPGPARAAEGRLGGMATALTRGGHDEQADHDRGRLARRPVLERADDQRVAQRPVAQGLRDELQVGVRGWRRPRRRAGRWSSSRTRSGSPARPPSRSSARRSRPPRPSRTPAGRPPRPPPSSAA